MNVELKLTAADGRSQSVTRELDRISDAYMLLDVVFDIRETGYDSEYVIYFQPERSIKLRKFELSFEFDPVGAYIYDAGPHTNAFVSILPADMPLPFSRDLFMACRDCSDRPDRCFFLNLGFTSFEKFFTYFTYKPGRVSAVYELEGREVKAGRILRLESIMIDDSICAALFFDSVCEAIAIKQKPLPENGVPVGWSSWSYYYGGIDGASANSQAGQTSALLKSVRGANEIGRKVVQLDNGWQQDCSFPGEYYPDPAFFPEGIAAYAEHCRELGLEAGLWLSPGLIERGSRRFQEFGSKNLYTSLGDARPGFSGVYPLDISADNVSDQLVNNIMSLKDAGYTYFKFDFITFLINRGDDSPVTYENGYSVENFRNFMRNIRKKLGNKVFLLACGSPIGEAAGIFNGIRTTPDVSWEGADKPSHPGYFNIITRNVQNMLLRAPYKKLFSTDPDGVILRDAATPFANDGVALTDSQAELLAVACAFSGGTLLINEDIDRLPPARRELFRNILPPWGVPARPVDFWEYPRCTHAFAKVEDKSVDTEFHILYNFDTEPESRILKVQEPSFFFDCLTGKLLGAGRPSVEILLEPCSVRVILVKTVPKRACFLWTDDNIYRGAGNTSDSYFGQSLIIVGGAPAGSAYTFFVPYGAADEIYFNEYRLKLSTLSSVNIDEGVIYTYVPKYPKRLS